MAEQGWRTVLAAVSAILALAAVVLVAVALFGGAGWTAVISVAAAAVVAAALSLSVRRDDGQHQ
jgi:hypothetical protein